jgi:protein gp37
MAETSIEWTANDDGSPGRTWNPTSGCDRVSPGCELCYAATMAPRLKAMGQPKYQRDGDPRTSAPGFGITEHPGTLSEPYRWRKSTRVFVDSMSDLFHAGVSEDFLHQVWDVMEGTPQHTYMILTKRAERMERVVKRIAIAEDEDYVGPRYATLENVWLGVSVETPTYYSRIRHLQRTPAAVRFLSCEPLLAPLPNLPLDGIDLVIIGGESGRGARPLDVEWVRDIIRQCRVAGAAVFCKQLGSVWARDHRRRCTSCGPRGSRWNSKGGMPQCWPDDLRLREMPNAS